MHVGIMNGCTVCRSSKPFDIFDLNIDVCIDKVYYIGLWEKSYCLKMSLLNDCFFY
jgi:hypothetical protein